MTSKNLLSDIELGLEMRARQEQTHDSELSKSRLLGYLDGIHDMRIELENRIKKDVRVKIANDTLKELSKKIDLLLILLSGISIFGGDENVEEIFGRDPGNDKKNTFPNCN